jgi:polyphosphate:AMP phosphotransferase
MEKCNIEKKEFNSRMKKLQRELGALQQRVKENNVPVLIVFEGWSAAGKGSIIARLVYPLDPRGFMVFTKGTVTQENVMRPFLCTYATNVPPKGRIAIYDKSWHRICLPEGEKAWELSHAEKDGFYHDVNSFEKQLVDDGVLVIKYFLHISKDEQKRRFEELAANEATRWRVDGRDWNQNENYGKYVGHFERMIEWTDTDCCPWVVVAADDWRYASVRVYETLIERINERLMYSGRQAVIPARRVEAARRVFDLDKTITNDEYNERLEYNQRKLANLCFKMYAKRVSVVIVYEGSDAAGKGGNIKRMTQELDPRAYEVVPVAAPTAEELGRHYLWRFWRKMPKDGHLTIFDRSWYGRVLVERVEGFARVDEWDRAYDEINDMELHLANHGVLIFKFWLQIDKDEQLARFKSRQEDEFKKHKITDEDWRNREKWDEYEAAVAEMLDRTGTAHAPWVVVESNNKKFARIKTLEMVTGILERKLDEA